MKTLFFISALIMSQVSVAGLSQFDSNQFNQIIDYSAPAEKKMAEDQPVRDPANITMKAETIQIQSRQYIVLPVEDISVPSPEGLIDDLIKSANGANENN